MPSAGAASVSSTTTASSAQASGRRLTRVAQRAISGTPVRSRPRRTRRGSSRWPASPHRAGTSVSAAEGDRDDGDGGGEAEGVVGRQAGQLEPEQRDQHGGRGEDHRASRGGDCTAGRLVLVVPGAQELDVPGDQQQRVVDADAEPDHRGHRRGRGADVHDGGQQGDAGRADAEADEGDRDGQARRRRPSRTRAPGSAARPRCRSARPGPSSGRPPCPAGRRRARPASRRRGSARPPSRADRGWPSGRGGSPVRRTAR